MKLLAASEPCPAPLTRTRPFPSLVFGGVKVGWQPQLRRRRRLLLELRLVGTDPAEIGLDIMWFSLVFSDDTTLAHQFVLMVLMQPKKS